MRLSTARTLLVLSVSHLVSGYHVIPRASSQLIDRRDTTYQGSWALVTPGSCPQNYSTACGSKTDVNQVCCRTGDTCFGDSLAYCCPSAQDCETYVETFPVCADPVANMYSQFNSYFCCQQGLTAVIPSSGYGFCEAANISVPVSLLATMASQFGGTSITPFGGYGASPTSPGGGPATNPAANPTAGSSSASSPSSSTSSSSGIFGLSTAEIIGIAVAAVAFFILAYLFWRRCCRNRDHNRPRFERSHRAGPPVMPAYLPPPIATAYSTMPAPPYSRPVAYDPIVERGDNSQSPGLGLGGRTPGTPGSPSPEYRQIDAQELGGRRLTHAQELAEGRRTSRSGDGYVPVEMQGSGNGVLTERMEME